jgi:hypothetical protein
MFLFYAFSLVLMLIGAFGLAFVGSWLFTVVGGLAGFIIGAILGSLLAPIIYTALFRRNRPVTPSAPTDTCDREHADSSVL